MKKCFVFLFIFLIFFPIQGMAKENYDKFEVILSRCVDGDTAKFLIDEKEVTARFLAIDTPETKHPTKGEEAYGKEASNYTCNALKKAQKIELKYDSNSDKKDKYDRILVWVFVDGELLQDQLIKEGLAEVAYLYGDYQYTPLLENHEAIAKVNKVGIWSGKTPTDYTMIFILVITIIIVVLSCIFNAQYRKKTIRKVKRKVKKDLKKFTIS